MTGTLRILATTVVCPGGGGRGEGSRTIRSGGLGTGMAMQPSISTFTDDWPG